MKEMYTIIITIIIRLDLFFSYPNSDMKHFSFFKTADSKRISSLINESLVEAEPCQGTHI